VFDILNKLGNKNVTESCSSLPANLIFIKPATEDDLSVLKS